MKKRVLIISASPRIGENSDYLCNQFMRGAKDAGHILGKGVHKAGEIKGNLAVEEAYNTGKNI